ncbi:MAG TPA: hypothetical protein VFI91_10980 [Longimicrobiaceae bacterium]|nr:hypothetical protein [Longimicrobiaceae bacterium]
MAHQSSNAAASDGAIRFSAINWIVLAIALVAIVAGYFSLAAGSTILAPLLLVLGYVVLIPVGIIL